MKYSFLTLIVDIYIYDTYYMLGSRQRWDVQRRSNMSEVFKRVNKSARHYCTVSQYQSKVRHTGLLWGQSLYSFYRACKRFTASGRLKDFLNWRDTLHRVFYAHNNACQIMCTITFVLGNGCVVYRYIHIIYTCYQYVVFIITDDYILFSKYGMFMKNINEV